MTLGKTQVHVLRTLKNHESWSRWSGWVWDTQSGTRRVLESLVKRGLVDHRESGEYVVSTAGNDWLMRDAWERDRRPSVSKEVR